MGKDTRGFGGLALWGSPGILQKLETSLRARTRHQGGWRAEAKPRDGSEFSRPPLREGVNVCGCRRCRENESQSTEKRNAPCRDGLTMDSCFLQHGESPIRPVCNLDRKSTDTMLLFHGSLGVSVSRPSSGNKTVNMITSPRRRKPQSPERQAPLRRSNRKITHKINK
ncbi:hypothetical protein P7K49_033887 [Saguinus oedipus]|uniref:Uncharacterized protein n=1 Tax=Saguinus oedipus TaxID=9490 RepID=A0ABQ9TT72_SAGOE|nr:hypothetical protein P7K49_033887 [Saguinus oedipus]